MSDHGDCVRWLDSVRALTSTPEQAEAYRDLRFRFADDVGTLASAPLETGPLRAVVYGVWIHAHRDPVYVGQTRDPGRRLYDLAIGLFSAGSILSIGSVGSVLSIGAAGAVLSIGGRGELPVRPRGSRRSLGASAARSATRPAG